jgi:hypothetical protein
MGNWTSVCFIVLNLTLHGSTFGRCYIQPTSIGPTLFYWYICVGPTSTIYRSNFGIHMYNACTTTATSRCGIRLTLYQRPDSPTNILRKETAMSINSTSNTFDHNFHYDEHSIISIRSTSSSVKPVHASTPINKRNAHIKSNLPLRVLNINLQSIKRKQHLVNNIISKVQNQIL